MTDAIGARSERPRSRPRRQRAEQTLRSILHAHRGERRSIAIAVFALRLSPVLVPVVLRFALDPLLHHEPKSFFGWTLSPDQLLILVVVAGALVALMRAVASYAYVAISGRAGHGLVRDLRLAAYEHILRMPVSYAERRGTGKILLRFIGDSESLRQGIARRGPSVAADRVLVVVLIGAMVWIDWRLAVVSAIPLPVIFVAGKLLTPRLRDLTLQARRLQAEFTGEVEARFDTLTQTKWLDHDRRNRRTIQTLADDIAKTNAARDRQSALLRATGQFLSFLAVPVLIGFGVWLVWANRVSVGSYVSFVWLAAHLAVAVNRLNAAVVVRQKARVSVDRMLRLLERTAEPGRSSSLREFVPHGRHLRVESTANTSDNNRAEGVDVRGPGVHSLAGPINVAEVYKLVLGFQKPRDWRITIDDQPLGDLNITSVRRAIGWLPAHPAIFTGTVLDNVRMAAPRIPRKTVKRAVRAFLKNKVAADEWLQRDAGPNGALLSAAERIRIGILRIVIADPKFILIENLTVNDTVRADLQRLISAHKRRAVICMPKFVAEQIQTRRAIHESDRKIFGPENATVVASLRDA